MIDMTDAKRRLVERLKRVDSATASELASEFDLTDTAVRQHLESLQEAGLVRRVAVARAAGSTLGRGRPAARWQLTSAAGAAFPDRHVDLTVELIESIRTELGEDVLDRIIDARSKRQTEQYRTLVGTGTVAVRVRRLAEQRNAEGYVAEVVNDGRDLVLVEHHCPICVAASTCSGLCSSELEVFRATLGDDVTIERIQHVFAGDQRCAYRITAA
ncbi:MAG: MarR family transcriptional regulator [Ilumatobacteraceae bacterium]|nr:MarR family transcriptional regulator [Ilumatobacteraceae bacterium]